MLDKKKIHFWQLTFVFASITILALAYSYGSYNGNQSQMMSTSMGQMMGMHLNNITVRELITQQEQVDLNQNQTQTSEHSSHHSGMNNFITIIHFLSIAIIVMLLPFIMGGSVFLAIVWLK